MYTAADGSGKKSVDRNGAKTEPRIHGARATKQRGRVTECNAGMPRAERGQHAEWKSDQSV